MKINLVKIMKIFDDTNEKEKLKIFKIIPPKYINEILSYFHIKNGQKGYLNLVYDTLNNGYYFNNVYRKSIEFIKQCLICTQIKKNIFKKPGIIQIISKAPKDIYQIDITIISEKLRDHDNTVYLLCIIEHFSKFANAYLLKTKTSEEILGNIKNFIYNYGKCKTLHSDNGKKFYNKKLETYCKENGIN